ncbi:hydrogenase maturation protease [Dehalogenimonas alkenigignens]|uniref:Hydrogenase maturation protease n=1 Tax=Dehalogenimonas alkenigignens TaxID=1217799 RepID=A0A0W0GJ41_9CHLR|nr:hydrogenase maturation protease [Dehalogenimonas alkenigignens]KTB48585.1 hydrogenase maturation protease [Dehalogenimonas alkenigignens]PVV84975.1 hydrogenase maturation protease [Dehalogenimonas alkenigignens]
MEYLPDYYRKDLLVLGVGNPLFGDDGYGPAVAEELNRRGRVPSFAAVLDVGTGVREILFDLILSPQRPSEVVIVDALDCGRQPGEVFTVKIDEVPKIKSHDFSLHLAPSLNLLKELRDNAGISVTIIAAQPEPIPEIVTAEMSELTQKAVDETANYIETVFFGHK